MDSDEEDFYDTHLDGLKVMKQLNLEKSKHYELVVIGNTNVGKSTFLNNLTKMRKFFNTSTARETSHIWRFQMVEDES